jgi:hypothetical protein
VGTVVGDDGHGRAADVTCSNAEDVCREIQVVWRPRSGSLEGFQFPSCVVAER